MNYEPQMHDLYYLIFENLRHRREKNFLTTDGDKARFSKS